MTTKAQGNVRALALDMVMEIAENGAFTHHVLNRALEKYYYLDKQQRGFLVRLTEGTVEYLLQLDCVINRYSATATVKMKPLIRNLLRISVYQLLYMDSVPPSAVCNEAVKLAGKRGFAGLKGFVNGVLRTVSREKENLVFETLSERYSMPQWLVDNWTKQYGAHTAKQMMASFLEPKKLSIRANRTNGTLKQLENSLAGDGVCYEKAPYVSDGLLLTKGVDSLYALEAFRNGAFQVQDVSSMLAVKAAMPKQGDTVLDVCAAPGGKALHIADLLEGGGYVEARDLTEDKIELIEDNIARAGFTNIRAVQWDACVYDESWEQKADLVIADLPCSGLGVIGRKPDIKYRVNEQQIASLQSLQRQILDTVYRYTKIGGTLLYSTCTVSRAENEENVQWLLANYPFELEAICAPEFEGIARVSPQKGYVQLLPGIHKGDGFFMARFRRKQSYEHK